MDAKDDHERDNPAHAADEKSLDPAGKEKRMPGLWRANVGQRPCGNKPGISFFGAKKDAGLVLYFGGYARNKPGTTSRCVRTNRRDEVFTSTSFRRIIGQRFHVVSTRSP